MQAGTSSAWLLPGPFLPACLPTLSARPACAHTPPLPYIACCSELLLGQLWPALPTEERAALLARLAEAEGREKLPAIKARVAQLAAKLRQLV